MRFRIRKKGLSPVVATLLMIAIAVAAGIITYCWAMGLFGGLKGAQQTTTPAWIKTMAAVEREFNVSGIEMISIDGINVARFKKFADIGANGTQVEWSKARATIQDFIKFCKNNGVHAVLVDKESSALRIYATIRQSGYDIDYCLFINVEWIKMS